MRTWLLTWNSESWECRKEKMNEIEQVPVRIRNGTVERIDPFRKKIAFF